MTLRCFQHFQCKSVEITITEKQHNGNFLIVAHCARSQCSDAAQLTKKRASAGGSGGAHFRARDRRDHFAITIHTRMHELEPSARFSCHTARKLDGSAKLGTTKRISVRPVRLPTKHGHPQSKKRNIKQNNELTAMILVVMGKSWHLF